MFFFFFLITSPIRSQLWKTKTKGKKRASEHGASVDESGSVAIGALCSVHLRAAQGEILLRATVTLNIKEFHFLVLIILV